jgi:hypothetical protein
MKKVYGVIILGCLLFVTSLFAADLDTVNKFSKLDDKINKALQNSAWHYVGKTFVRALWDDFKIAHENTEPELTSTRIHGKTPDIQDYSQYMGIYTRDNKKDAKIFLEIKKSDKGTFFVELAGYHYPAVATGKSIVFTTGTITSSTALPRLAAKPYCMLAMYMISRIEDTYFFLSTDAAPSEWVELFKDVEKGKE